MCAGTKEWGTKLLNGTENVSVNWYTCGMSSEKATFHAIRMLC